MHRSPTHGTDARRLHAWPLTPPPVRRARPRDDAVIIRGREATWPASNRRRQPSRWDDSPMHRSHVIQEFLAHGAVHSAMP